LIDLLRQPRTEGYPTDFLLARLRGKRQYLTDMPGRVTRTSVADSWELLQADYRWLFEAMQPPLRQRYAPCFLYYEVRSVQMLLRAFIGLERSQIERLCQNSLLRQELLKQVCLCETIEEVLAVLDGWLGRLLSPGVRLVDLYALSGNRAVEETLTDGLLRHITSGRHNPEVAEFFREQVDFRNLLTAGRYLRWELGEIPLLNGGGEVSRQLIAAAGRSDSKRMQQVITEYVDDVSDIALFESVWLARCGRRLEMAGRDPLGGSLILDYLWRRYQAFRQTGLNFWSGESIGVWEGAI
jgi:hypothetical protein